MAAAIKDSDPDIRITGVRLARQLKLEPGMFIRPLLNDPDPAVRRECAIALHHSKAAEAAGLWAELATRHDGEDRWYLEALGIGADQNWDAFLDAYLSKVGDQWNSPVGRDIIWRSRAQDAGAVGQDHQRSLHQEGRSAAVLAGVRLSGQKSRERKSFAGLAGIGITDTAKRDQNLVVREDARRSRQAILLFPFEDSILCTTMIVSRSFALWRFVFRFCPTACLAFGLFSASSSLLAQEADPAKDALIVETLLRLDHVDLDAKPKTKAAVLRFLKANPGSEQFFQLIERFEIKDAGGMLLDLAVAKPNETVGVKATELLIKIDDQDRIAQTLVGEDAVRAAALATPLGNVGGKVALERLMPLVTDAKQPLAVRSAAATALGKSKAGEAHLLELAKDKKLTADITFTVANVLLASAQPQVRDEAAKYLQLPAASDARSLPPLGELVKMQGNAAHGKELFAEKATCGKCHIVGGQGRDVGPNLSEIGSKLGKDALLVAILDPNAGISHNYETYLAVTDDGKTISGLLVSKTDEELVLKDAGAIVHTLKLADVEEFKKLPTSLMPADLQKLMSAQDLIDVVEYLMTLKKP